MTLCHVVQKWKFVTVVVLRVLSLSLRLKREFLYVIRLPFSANVPPPILARFGSRLPLHCLSDISI